MAITGIFIGCAFILFISIHFSSKVNKQFSRSVKNYYSYIAKDIGSPPDTLLAKTIADEYFIAIGYVGSNPDSGALDWQYGNFDDELPKDISHILQFTTGFWHDDPLVINNADRSKFIFSADFHRILNPKPWELLVFFISLIVILSISYLVIKNILKPIKSLSKGVDEVSKGNLEYKVDVINNDELTMLSLSFNEMTKRVKEMIESKNQLLLDVSHELRSPLTRIKVALQLIEDNPSLLNKNKDRISTEIKELEMMITELLESERLNDEYGKPKLVSYNFRKLLDEVLTRYNDSTIIIRNVPADLYLRIDVERIKLVLNNIIDNSIKFSPNKKHPVFITVDELNDKAIINIKDEGIGIPEADLPYIFEPFYKVDKSRTQKSGGYGLGLSLCKKIIEAHKGIMSISNNDGSGITVTIELLK